MAYGNYVPTNQDYAGINSSIGNKGTGDNPKNNFWQDMKYEEVRTPQWDNMPQEDDYSLGFEENQGGLLSYILNNLNPESSFSGENIPMPQTDYNMSGYTNPRFGIDPRKQAQQMPNLYERPLVP